MEIFMTNEEINTEFTKQSAALCGRKNNLSISVRYQLTYNYGLCYRRYHCRKDYYIIRTVCSHGGISGNFRTTVDELKLVQQSTEAPNSTYEFGNSMRALKEIEQYAVPSAHFSYNILLYHKLPEDEVIRLLTEFPFTHYAENDSFVIIHLH